MVDKHSFPEFIQRMNDLMYPVVAFNPRSSGDIGLYRIDLSRQKLNFSHFTPVVHVTENFLRRVGVAGLTRALEGELRDFRWFEACIVLLDGDGSRLKQSACNQFGPHFLLIDREDQKMILQASDFERALLDLCMEQAPLSWLTPYEESAPVFGSRFFGRKAVLRRILRIPMGNFAILGVRKIGKTSLLREVEHQVLSDTQGGVAIATRQADRRSSRISTIASGDAGPLPPVVYADASVIPTWDDFVFRVVSDLHIRETTHLERRLTRHSYFPNFLQRMFKMYKKPTIILVDEADVFVEWSRNDRIMLDKLRSPAQRGHCRFIIAGSRTLSQEINRNASPFYNFLQPLDLKPFDEAETRELLFAPLEKLGIQFDRPDEILAEVFKHTNGHPHLIQCYCSQLVEHLEMNQRQLVELATVARLANGDAFKKLILDSFLQNVYPDDKILVYSLLIMPRINFGSFTQQHMYGALQRSGCRRSQPDIDASCDRLEWAGVFIRKEDHFAFANNILPQMLRSFNLEFLLKTTMREVNS